MDSGRILVIAVILVIGGLVAGAVYILSGDMSVSQLFLDVFSYHG